MAGICPSRTPPVVTRVLRSRRLLLAAQDARDPGGDGREEDPADGDKQVGEPALRSLRVVGAALTEIDQRDQQVQRVDERIEGGMRNPGQRRRVMQAEGEGAGGEE